MKKLIVLFLSLGTPAVLADVDAIGYVQNVLGVQLWTNSPNQNVVWGFGGGVTNGPHKITSFGADFSAFGADLTGFETVNIGYDNNDNGMVCAQMFGYAVTATANFTTFIGSAQSPQSLYIYGEGTNTWGATNNNSGNGWLFGPSGFFFDGAPAVVTGAAQTNLLASNSIVITDNGTNVLTINTNNGLVVGGLATVGGAAIGLGQRDQTGGIGNGNLGTEGSGNIYWPAYAVGSTRSATETNYSQYRAGVICLTNLVINFPGLLAGTNVGFNLRTNGASTGIWVVIDGPATIGSDTAHFAQITNGWIDIMETNNTASSVTVTMTWSFQE